MINCNILKWHEAPIHKLHDRKSFDCGTAKLNDFLKHHARKNHEIGSAKTFLAIDDNHANKVLGFYSLSVASIQYHRLPETVKRNLARYEVPVFRLARLAVDLSVQGQGIGGQLLLLAGRRCMLVAQEVGGVALLIDAKNETIVDWYISYGALPLLDTPLTLILPFKSIENVIKNIDNSIAL